MNSADRNSITVVSSTGFHLVTISIPGQSFPPGAIVKVYIYLYIYMT